MNVNPMKFVCLIFFSIVLLFPIYVQAACLSIPDGIYVIDNDASEVSKEGKRSNVMDSLKKSDPSLAATTLGFSVAVVKNGNHLSFSRTIGNSLDERYSTLSIRAETSSPAACNSEGALVLQASQYYPEELNFFGKPRSKAKKLPESIRMNLSLIAVEPGVLRIRDCQTEVKDNGQWRIYNKYDSVDLCRNLKLRKMFDIYPDVQGKKGWEGIF